MSELGSSELILQPAEQRAMEKVVDIYNTPLLKHTFLRHNAQFDIEDRHLPSVDRRESSNDRLQGILQHGLISDIEADEGNVVFSRNWGDPNNNAGVSVFTEDASFDFVGIQAGPPLETILKAKAVGEEQRKIPAEEAFAILIDPKQEEYKSGRTKIERVYPRIPRNSFKGIVIFDNSEYIAKGFGKRFFDPANFNAEELINELVKLMKECFGDNNDLYLPIYGFFGNLYWPKRMTKQEIDKMGNKNL